MIIISNKPGQLGNLLFIYASFLGYSFESGSRILNPAFYPYRSYFKSTSSLKHINRFFYGLCFLCARVLHRLKVHNRLINVIALENGEHAELMETPLLNSKFCFVQGWLFRADAQLIKHKNKLHDFFSPVDELQHKIDLFFSSHFKDPDITIVGVHIRRGDYSSFQNGRYFYSDEQYLSLMRAAGQLFGKEKVAFLVCSNERVKFSPQEEKQLNIFYGPDHELMDMYSLARCHYIIAPPSTYTMWASFWGDVPLYMVHDPEKDFARSDFKISLS